jgi:hypothetical protein
MGVAGVPLALIDRADDGTEGSYVHSRGMNLGRVGRGSLVVRSHSTDRGKLSSGRRRKPLKGATASFVEDTGLTTACRNLAR